MNGGQVMTWADFKLKFSKYHVPPGLIKKMRDEFRELKQGRMTVVEYRDRFLTLSRYAPDEIDTTEKRQERFLNGLHDEMQTILVNIPFADLEALVDSAIQMEGKLNQANENRKRHEDFTPGLSKPEWRKPQARRPPQQQPQLPEPHQQLQPRPNASPNANNNNTNTAPRTGSNAIPVATKDKATITCYECGVVGHYSNECPKRLAKLAGNTAAPAQQQRRVSTGKKFAPNNPNNRSGRLFHMNAEEAQEAPDVVLALHGTPKSIVSDRGSQFTSRFWQKVHEGLGTRLNFSTAYHPQTDGQTERVNQILEDMLRACVLEYGSKWEDCLPYAEFSYNNSYQASLQMAPFEALYGRKCRTPLNWSEVGESQVFGPDVLRSEEKVHKIREYLKTAQSRQKSYTDKRRREMTFEIGDFVYLKVSPLKGMQRFQLKGKLAPRYVGPFKVLSRRGEVSYKLELPEEMAAVHDVFHISLLRKCLEVPEKTEVFKNIDHRSVDINTDLTYREVPIRILEEAYRTTRTRSIKFLKIQWSNHTEDEATWEREEDMKKEYPDLFST
ncbi:hypothetical protein QYE76_022343 [Lolium multiflorum]|uniref:Uncharacterized protein n=1 Tax=Lolium multiflorum TaxID=4521 RepID=A0AAD8RA50_LOLMU|nr:hypothetical protein QYE76_022343 [Lolium multiflorum]